jgi:AraC family transcriptional regulator, transcriptional activator of pobA
MDDCQPFLYFSPTRLSPYSAPMVQTPAPASPYRPTILAAPMVGSFADQTWSTRSLDGVPCFRAFLLRRGRGVFAARQGAPIELAAPQILWAPFSAGGDFRLLAGGDGASILVSEDLVWRVVADNPLGSQLRPMLDRTFVAPVDRMGGDMAEIDALFSALARETRQPGAGAPAMSGLYLGLVVMHLWRACGAESGALDAATPTVQRFRQLVEMHYRDNLGVEDFCRMLDVTRAHLHNACVRTFGRSPQRLVRERLAVEARLRLRQTAQPIEQIAYGLGFRDPAYFNRFFRRLSGMPPGAYRKAARVAPPREATSFEAWP